MTVQIIIVQLFLGIVLFFIINWIGKHSISLGYISLSMFVRTEEAPAFNFIFRVLTPIVYLLITASILYGIGLDRFVLNFYLVNVFYIAFRLLINLTTGRGLLLNWGRQFTTWFCIVILSLWLYENIIIEKKNLLPDFSTIANELWIIIIIFLYQLSNKIEISSDNTARRKDFYIQNQYKKFKKRYSKIIDEKVNNEKIKAIIYSILIYENFNRPKLIRMVEKISFKLKGKPHTLGIMQVYTNKLISDVESVKLGVEKIMNDYNEYLLKFDGIPISKHYHHDYDVLLHLINKYNGGTKYFEGVTELYEIIESKFFLDTKDRLLDVEFLDEN